MALSAAFEKIRMFLYRVMPALQAGSISAASCSMGPNVTPPSMDRAIARVWPFRMFCRIVPPANSTAWLSSVPVPAHAPVFQVLPWSSL